MRIASRCDIVSALRGTCKSLIPTSKASAALGALLAESLLADLGRARDGKAPRDAGNVGTRGSPAAARRLRAAGALPWRNGRRSSLAALLLEHLRQPIILVPRVEDCMEPRGTVLCSTGSCSLLLMMGKVQETRESSKLCLQLLL